MTLSGVEWFADSLVFGALTMMHSPGRLAVDLISLA